jgi:hypothetical protein
MGLRLSQLDARTFNRGCAIGAFVYLLVSMTISLCTPISTEDFPQYYMAGLVARHAAWDVLYPIPDPQSLRNPGFVEDSFMKPHYAQMAKEVGIGDRVRYIQPPPFALFLSPLSWMSYRQAFVVWNVVTSLCMFGICVQSGRIFTVCHGAESKAAGYIMLLLAVSPETYRWTHVQNTSVIIGWLLGVATLDLLPPHVRSIRGAAAIWFSTIAKYAGIALVPLYVVQRKWIALATAMLLGIATLGISIAIMGTAVFHEFIHVIAPTLGRCTTLKSNQSIEAFVLFLMHLAEPTQGVTIGLRIAEIATILLILGLIFLRPRSRRVDPPNLFAAAMALVLWMLLFSPIYWEHYMAYAAPLWGWLIWEATQGTVRRWLCILILPLVTIPSPILEQWHVPEFLFVHYFWASCLMFIIAIWRMAQPESLRGEPHADH